MKFTTLIKWGLALIVLIACAGCSKDNTDAPDGYGYVQLRIYKSGSYTRADRLDYLYDAAKIKIILLNSDNNTISQTVNVEAASKALAEYGMQSDKFLLMSDTYTVIGFEIFDKLDNPILSDEPENPTRIKVVRGGLTVQDLTVNTVERGHVRFQLTKDLSRITRANETTNYPFHKILSADVKIQNTNTLEIIDIKGLATKHNVFRPDTMPDYYTSVCETDSLVSLKAGKYKVIGYTTYFDKGRKVAEASTNVFKNEFLVYDNQKTTANVPVTLLESKGYIKDAIALKAIWDALDGPNWKVKWDFNRDIDLWSAQSGVQVLEDGRIAVLNLSNVGAKGDMPAALGELTELRQLYLGSHSFEPGSSKMNPSRTFTEMTPVDMETMRSSFMKTFIRNSDPLEIFSPEMQLSFELNNVPMKKTEGELRALHTANNPFNYSNLVYSLPEEIKNLKRLEFLFIAFSPITELPSDLSGMESLTDVELYCCPNLTTFPDGLATLPKLISLVFSSHHNLMDGEMERWLKLFNDSPNLAKTLQLLHIPNQKFKKVPDLANLVTLDLLNIQDCGIEEFETAFGKNHSFSNFMAGYNNLTSLPRDGEGYFIGLDDVELIDFSHNKFTKFPDMFDSSSIWVIKDVRFAFNEIEEIENGGEGGSFKGINATTLSLAYNKLKNFPEELFHSDSEISYLQVQGNGIESIDDDAFEGKNTYLLTAIDLSYNKLKELPNTFHNATFPYMTGIDLSYNRFEAFPYIVLNLANLNVFIFRHQRDANGNRTMREWPANVSMHNGLRALYLGSNDLRRVSSTGSLSPRIYVVEICDNPNIVLDVSNVCPYINAGVYYLYYDPTQDLRGCSSLKLER